MRKFLFLLIFILNLNTAAFSKNDLYEKIDLFGEVLENIKKDYVDEVDQAEMMDSAINGVLQSLDPYSAYMSPELFKEMQTDTKGEFGGLGIEIGMEAGVVKVISPIDDTPAAEAGIKAIRVNCFLYFELSISLTDQMLPQRKNKITEKYIWPK